SLEALIRAMQDKNALWSCDLVSGKACVEQREEYIETLYPMSTHRKQDLLQEDGYEQHVFDHSCHVCRLFGSPFFASKVFIKDSQLLYNESGEPIAFSRIELRDFVAIDRDTGTARHQGKFDAEVVPTGTQFGLEMIIENPEEYELGLILLGFDLFNEGHLRLGGLASRGLGRIRINMETIERSTLEAVLGSGPESIDITTLRVNAMSALRQRFAPVKTEEETPHA
ncbi:MAG: RAMP superfamily CRISPR-associated protein, partial [Syntrophobacteraceae bacterium]